LTKKRKQYKAEFKFQIALGAVKGLKRINQLASEHEFHPNQVSQWKRQLLEEGDYFWQWFGPATTGSRPGGS